ncbi:MAG: formamidopyrimidine DNA glycosylase [Deltaproteobacteria bacterium]|nr:MAG: formamidopyrimidine DNA glycosylase [Deltaproteobacteria bacterium]
MPEGDTIAQWADQVRHALVGKRVVRAELALQRRPLAGFDVGSEVVRVEAVGKHLLIGTERRWIRGHVGLHGAWRVGGPSLSGGRQVGVRVEVEDAAVLALRTTEVELTRYVDEVRRLPRLASLGPDLMHEVDLDLVVGRARVVRDRERTLAAVLTDQVVACGLGNVYKSEVCFLSGRHPLTPLDDLEDAELKDAFALGARLLRENRHEPRRRTRQGPGPRLWVYDRAGQPCLRCADAIRVARHTDFGRPVWWCPACQPTGR